MSENQRESANDSILQAFEETKGEQMGLFDKEEATPVIEKEDLPKEEATKYHIGFDDIEYPEEEWNSPVVRNGPTRREVEGWKERYNGLVYFTPFDGEVFVWRTLQRPEYREIISNTTLTALDREELFTEKCVLFPYDFSLEKIKKHRAGVPSLLSEMLMDKSGFVAQSAPIKL